MEMMRFSILLLFLTVVSMNIYAQETIASARQKVNQTITVGGIVSNGPELGGIRYFQDHTGGLAAYDYNLMLNVLPGDSIIVTGKLVDYNNLLEITPLTSVTVVSSGNKQYAPIEITIGEIGEMYESQVIKIKNVVFDNAGSLFQGNKNYNFRANGEMGIVRINNASEGIIGQIVPSGEVDLIAICSQFSYTTNDVLTGYQMLPRTMADFITEGAIRLTSPISISDISTQGFNLGWNTNATGSCQVIYGFANHPDSLIHKVTGTVTKFGNEFLNKVELKGLPAGSIIFANAYTFDDGDTAQSSIKAYATESNSSGKMLAYFNTEVDHSVSKGVDAVFLNRTIDDTLIAYINRASETIDFTIYNYNNQNISDITVALNAAHARGVKLRIISCGTANNFGFEELTETVPYMKSPDKNSRDGLMHNKFVIFDAHSTNPNVPIVWTGATNFTDGQINSDPNNVIIVQDQSLALTYEIEFEEMWGSVNETPSPENARFGMFKKDNTPHEFIIGGKRVECYFSPSDGTNQKLLEAINTTDSDLSIASMLITRTDLAYSIRDAKERGVAVNIVTNAAGDNTDPVNEILNGALGVGHFVYNEFVKGIMHHKYAIIDQSAPNSDPILITGSHNWSASANDRNDENTLIIHDETIANIYYQNFVKLFTDNKGSFTEINTPPLALNDFVSVEKNGTVTINVLDNDLIQGTVEVSIETGAVYGNAYIPFTNPNVITYQAQNNFVGIDSVQYRVSYSTNAGLNDVATIIIEVGTSGITQIKQSSSVGFYPNPASDYFRVVSETPLVRYEIFNITGVCLTSFVIEPANEVKVDMSKYQSGHYFVKVEQANGAVYVGKIVVE